MNHRPQVLFSLLCWGCVFLIGCGIPTTTPSLTKIDEDLIDKPLENEDDFEFAYTEEVGDNPYFRGIEIYYKIYPDGHTSISSDREILNQELFGSITPMTNIGYHRLAGYVESTPGDYDARSPLIQVPLDDRDQTIPYTLETRPVDSLLPELNDDDDTTSLIICYRDLEDTDLNDLTTLKGFTSGSVDLGDDDLYNTSELFGTAINYDLVIHFYAVTYGRELERLTPIYSDPAHLGELILAFSPSDEDPEE